MSLLLRLKLAGKKKWTSQFTYGYQRAEVLGALINGVFLLALCFTITLEAIERFFNPHPIEKPEMVLIVGGVGLAVNILGLFLFHEHGHGHGHSHGHSHDHGHHHTHAHAPKAVDIPLTSLDSTVPAFTTAAAEEDIERHLNPYLVTIRHPSDPSTSSTSHADLDPNLTAPQPKKARSLNMHGVFLHVLGDALGSFAVIISALIIWLTTWEYRFLFDPILSLVITAIILVSTVPLVRSACVILLQGTPNTVRMEDVRAELLNVTGVVDIHELHVWQLSDTKIIASVHVVCVSQTEFMQLANEIKRILHNHSIHSVTVQPEFRPMQPETAQDEGCMLRCDDRCAPAECCPSDVVMQWSQEMNVVSAGGGESSEQRRRFFSVGQRGSN